MNMFVTVTGTVFIFYSYRQSLIILIQLHKKCFDVIFYKNSDEY